MTDQTRDLPETATPDRDPALEAAVERFIAVGGPFYRLELGSAFRAGWGSALRSLGAATPEAVAALRELVTVLAYYWRLRSVDGPASTRVQEARIATDEASRTFGELAALATPTEEGR